MKKTNSLIKVFAGISAAALLAISAGCGVNTGAGTGSASSSSTKQSQDTIKYALWSNPKGLFHPLTYFTDYDRDVIFNVYSRLVTVGDNQEFKDSLAKSHKWSADGKQLIFKLREGVKWHDGQLFSSEDVAYTYSAEANPEYPADVPDLVKHLKGYADYHSGKTDTFAGITTPDANTVIFNFETPYSGALAHFADRPVLAKHVWQKVPLSQWNQAGEASKHPIGTGPYKFKKFVDGQYVALEANPDYYGGAPKTKNLIFKIVSPDVLQTAAINKEVDIAEISNFNSKELNVYKDSGISIKEQEGNGGQFLALDVTNPKLSDKRVRQAIAYAIDKKGLISSLLYGHGVTFAANAQPSDPAYPKNLNNYKFNKEKAKKLLKEAGWADTDGDGILDKDGQKFTFTLNYPTGNKTRELSAPIIQKNLKDIGIDATLNEADFNATLSILQNSSQRYDGVLMGSTFRPGLYGGINWWSRWCKDGSAEKRVLDEIGNKVDESARRQAISEYLKLENDEVPFVELYIPNQGTAVRPEVQGFKRSTYEIFNHVTDWTVSAR